MLNEGVDRFVLYAIQFGVFLKGHVSRPANSLQLAESASCLAFQSIEFCAHDLRQGGTLILNSCARQHKYFSGRQEEYGCGFNTRGMQRDL